jgi:hypothetical protein
MSNKTKVYLLLAFLWGAWGSFVDAQGFPVRDQVWMCLILSIGSIISAIKDDRHNSL